MKTKGLTFMGLVSFVRDRFGQDALWHILENLVDDPRLFLGSLDPFRWYPSELFNEIFEVVMRDLGNGDPSFAREIGAETSKLHQRLSPGDFIRTPEADLAATLNRFWLLYHDQGRVSVIEDGEGFILRVACPITLTRSYMEGVAGWMENLMVVWGMENYAIISSDEPMELRMVRTGSGHAVNNSNRLA
jgi:hypothetical protein